MRIGLTGGIGSGKSTVAARLVARGATLVDTDVIARSLTAPAGAAIDTLRLMFGERVIGADGALDRAVMRQLAFADATARQRLEAVLHPMIAREALRQGNAARSGPVVYDVPLLAESGHWRRRVQRVLVVDCDEATQVERVRRRSGWDETTVRRVIAQQVPRAVRRAVADAVIHNQDLGVDALHAEVDALWRLWIGVASPAV